MTDLMPGMSELNRLIAYSAANELRSLGYNWDGKTWRQPETEHAYICKACEAIYWQDDVACDCSVPAVMQFEEVTVFRNKSGD